MKFNGSIQVNLPQEKVAQLFADPKYLKHYQDGFLRKIHISGIEGQDGAIAKMYYKHGSGEMELTETITANLLPNLRLLLKTEKMKLVDEEGGKI